MKIKFTLFLAIILTGFYGFASNAWNAKSNFGGVGRHRGTGMAIGNRGYMGLGHYNGAGPNILFQDWWEYDPGTNTWSQKANYPFPTYAASSFVIDNKGYVGTGVSAGNLFYSFDPIANVWTAIQPVPIGATDQVGFGVNGKGYYLYSNSLYEYDALTNAWTLKNPIPFFPSSWCSAFTIGDKAYIKSGASLYEYKSTTDEWTARAAFPGLASGGSAAFAVKGKGYIVCGYIGWLSELSDEVWEFDPALNQWTLMEEFPGSARRFSSGFAIGEKGYVGIGTTGTNMRDFWEFDELLSIENSVGTEITIFPNPASEYLSVKAPVNSILHLYDLNGNMVLNQIVNDSDLISINEFQNGTYIVEIIGDNLRHISKLIIRK